ncbi:DsbA family protein [Rhodanobacter aciditrophus]|uniref:DsbA family protein n=1 Tax=Rhodanobacter aciditrophus TaxID=1623218 RepID=A0ABW4B067_9GAMM
MQKSIDIQFVSDVMCPWCVVGLGNLNKALTSLNDVKVDLTFRPFELNPNMPQEGQNLGEHLAEKYGVTPAQSKQNREMIQARGKAVDFDFNFQEDSRMWNSFDAHRLLHWAEIEGCQEALKKALFKAHFTDNRNVSDHQVLIDIAGDIGLDQEVTKGILASDEFAEEVRQLEQLWQRSGITSVPTVIINNQYAISGGQPPEVFLQALEEVLNQPE